MKKTLLCLLILLNVLAHPLQAAVDVQSRLLTTSDGLVNNSVRCIYQDSKGFLWIGTLNGLSQYDGHTFLNFTPERGEGLSLADHHITAIDEDRHGFLWISTMAEVFSCYDLRHDCFVDYTGCGEYRQNYNHRLETKAGDTWLWHRDNGCRRVTYAQGRFASEVYTNEGGRLPGGQVQAVEEDTAGNI